MNRSSPEAPEMRRDAVIFDVDGTLCDVRTIRHFVERSSKARRFKRDFNRFHAESLWCPPHAQVRQIAVRAHNLGFAVVVVTGREAKWRELTLKWLNMHQVPCDELCTRKVQDYRPDRIVKSELEASIRMQFHAVLAIDDRSDIIEVWQKAGISTITVDSCGELMPLQACPNAPVGGKLKKLIGLEEEE